MEKQIEKKSFDKAAVLKAAVFSLLILISLYGVTRIVVPKFLVENSSWPSTSTFTQFYDVQKDSIDAICLGSSSMASAFIPQHLYNTKKYTGYNLGSPEQTLITSYYWLKESLRYQKPKVLFLDNQMLFTYYEDEPLNFKEPGLRKDFDYMKWSKVKIEAVHDICSLDESQSELSYYFPIIRYHDRHKELTKLDFTYTPTKLYGYAPLYGNLHAEDEPAFVPLSDEITEEDNTILPLMEEYMNKILALCDENEITVVLVTTLSPVQVQSRHNQTAKYAEKHGIDYIDFNAESTFNAVGFDYFTDCYDDHHMAFSGSKKITDYLGNYMSEHNLCTERESADFESTKDYYQDFVADFN